MNVVFVFELLMVLFPYLVNTDPNRIICSYFISINISYTDTQVMLIIAHKIGQLKLGYLFNYSTV